jgi:type I restriction enzyme, S subunit
MSKEMKPALSKAEGLIPELRFPEFVGDGEWVERPLIDTADKKIKWSFTGGPFGSNLKANNYTENGFRIIQLQNIGDAEFNDDSKIYTSANKADELISCNIYSGNIIISKMGDPVGRACIIPQHLKRCVMASDGIRLVVDEKKYSKYFIFSLINSKQIREAIERKSTGSTRKRIGLNDLKEIKLTVPKNLQEQQKIAACLSSLDELIAAHKDKLDALKDHKKGLLQNLFPQEGETVPKVRFPEFEGDGEWVIRSVEKNIDLISGIALKSKELSEDNSGTPILRGINITEGQIRHSEEIDKFYLEDTSGIERYIVEKNDIVIGMDGSKVGKNVALISNQDAGAILIQRVARIRAINSDVTYLYQHFLSNSFRSYVDNVNTSSGIPHISAKQIRDFEIGFPPTIKEQQKIAACLSSVDELIAAQKEKIEQLQQHKKGLMQNLFPNNLNHDSKGLKDDHD